MLFLFFFVLFSIFLSFVGAKVHLFLYLSKDYSTNLNFEAVISNKSTFYFQIHVLYVCNTFKQLTQIAHFLRCLYV